MIALAFLVTVIFVVAVAGTIIWLVDRKQQRNLRK